MTALPLLLALASATPKVHVYSAGDAGFRVNAYIVEAKEGVILIDATFTVSDARALRKQVDALEKPILAVLVTHAHPDHVNGITEVVRGRDPAPPVYATQAVLTTLRAIDAPKREYWGPIYKDEYPKVTTFPDHVIADGDAVRLGGLTFRAHDFGAGESESSTVWILEGKQPVAFAGDLIMNRLHPWLAEGRSGAWIEQLDRLATVIEKTGVTKVYAGHGESAGPKVVAWQKQYLETYRSAVRDLARGGTKLDDKAKRELERRMAKLLPDGPLAMLVAMGADAVAAELAASPEAGTPAPKPARKK